MERPFKHTCGLVREHGHPDVPLFAPGRVGDRIMSGGQDHQWGAGTSALDFVLQQFLSEISVIC